MVQGPRCVVRGSLVLAWLLSLVAAFLLGGCGEPTCSPGEVAMPDGTCRPPDKDCAPGEWPSEDGTCHVAGVPPGACAEGFEPDGSGGCNAILPAETCPFGQMAVPGETSCREVAPCGDGPWGTIPVEASTQFVDQDYAGGDSDGTMAKPWTTVRQGVDAAANGAIVAVTDGIYEEDILIDGKAVRLWGRCPGRVEIRGVGEELGTIRVLWSGADGTEIRGLAVTSMGIGIDVLLARDVRIEQVWVHDAALRGMHIVGVPGPRGVTVSGSLIERNNGTGVWIRGADVAFSATVVRDNQSEDGLGGRGIRIQEDESTAERANVSIQGCVVERNHEIGVYVRGSDAEISATVVRATQPVNSGLGTGIYVRDNGETRERANVGIRGCVVEQNHWIGVLVMGSDVELEATVVRATQPVDGQYGWGMSIRQHADTLERAKVGIRFCLVEQNHGEGVFVMGSDAELEATVVRATQPVNEQFGRGIGIEVDLDTGARANVGIRGCVVEQNHEIGVFVMGSDAELDATVVRATQPVNEQFGRGIGIEVDLDTGARADVGIRDCVVEQNHDTGVFIMGSDAELDATVVRATQPVNEQFGRGIGIQQESETGARADVGIRGCVVEQNHDIGVFIMGSDAKLEATVVRATQPVNEQFGRGMSIREDPDTGEPSVAVINGCTVEQSHDIGIAVVFSDATIEATTVRDTAADADGSFGDGIAVDEGTVRIQSSTVSGSARAGVSNFGSEVTILSSSITCNGIDINGEAVGDNPFSFDGSDGWQCSRAGAEDCTESGTCHVLSANIEPPPMIGPAEVPASSEPPPDPPEP